jgi:DNA-binding response OmpR family regulator
MTDPTSDPQSPLDRVPAPHRVLILESDRLLRDLVVEWLHMAGFETLCASDSASAARIARAGCELMLADVPAPLKLARDSVAMLADAMPNTPIVAMSADVVASSRTASDAIARELGVAAVLVKPFTRETLLRAVRRARA